MSAVEILQIPITEIETRLLRACKTLRALPDREKGWQVVRSLWPVTADDPDMAYGYTAERMPQFNPNRFDVGDYLTALAWLRGSEKSDFRFVWWRSFDLSFGWMSRRLRNMSDESCRRHYRETIRNAWYEANWPSTKSA